MQAHCPLEHEEEEEEEKEEEEEDFIWNPNPLVEIPNDEEEARTEED